MTDGRPDPEFSRRLARGLVTRSAVMLAAPCPDHQARRAEFPFRGDCTGVALVNGALAGGVFAAEATIARLS